MNSIYDDALTAIKPTAALAKGFRSVMAAIEAEDQDLSDFAVVTTSLHRLAIAKDRSIVNQREFRNVKRDESLTTDEYEQATAALAAAEARHSDLESKVKNPAPIPECTPAVIDLLRKIRGHLEAKITIASSVRADTVIQHQEAAQRAAVSAAKLAQARVAQALGETVEPVQADPAPEDPKPILAELDRRIEAMQSALTAADGYEHRMIAEVVSADLTQARTLYQAAAEALLTAAASVHALGSIYHEHLNQSGRNRPDNWLSGLSEIKVPALHSEAVLATSDLFALAVDKRQAAMREAGVIL